MKPNMKVIAVISGTCAAAFLAFSTHAEDVVNPNTTRTSTESVSMVRMERLESATKAGDLIGLQVRDSQNEKIGKVDDVTLDVESGRIVHVIISSGGVLGLGTKYAAVPPGVLRLDTANHVVHMDVTREKFNGAPLFDNSMWDEQVKSNRLNEVYAYYGEQPYFLISNGYWVTNLDGTITRALPRHMDGTVNTDAPRLVEKVRNEEQARIVEGQPGTSIRTVRNADGTFTPALKSTDSSWPRLGYVQRASKLLGATVNNLQAQKVGTVNNFILDLPAGRIVAVIVSAGGFLGIGDELNAVPPIALQYNASRDAYQIDASKETLASSPHFKATEWPDMSQPGYVGQVYQSYGYQPYFENDAPAAADNTRRNVRDRYNQTLTPLDQGNTASDIQTSAQIRKELMADANLSVTAKNIKIITRNGQVTLRGPVNSPEEKRRIEEIALRISHLPSLDNQLEPKAAVRTSDN